jgi:hypothetical protein
MNTNISATPPVTRLALGFWTLPPLSASIPWVFALVFSASQHCLGPTPVSSVQLLAFEMLSGAPFLLKSSFAANISLVPPSPVHSPHHPHHEVVAIPTKRSLKMESYAQITTIRKLMPQRGKRFLPGRWFMPESFVWLH